MSADLSEFMAANTTGGGRCRVLLAVAEMSPEQRTKFEAALASPNIQTTAIVRVLKGWAIPIGEGSINRHRQKRCACD